MNTNEISNVISQGRAYRSSSFLIKWVRDRDIKGRKVAFLVSKKNFPTAVSRNKAKRVAREAFLKSSKAYIQDQYVKNDLKEVCLAINLGKSILETDPKSVVSEFEQFFIKGGMLLK